MIEKCLVNSYYTNEVIMFNLKNLFLYTLFLFLPFCGGRETAFSHANADRFAARTQPAVYFLAEAHGTLCRARLAPDNGTLCHRPQRERRRSRGTRNALKQKAAASAPTASSWRTGRSPV